jgi:hypothetical protein
MPMKIDGRIKISGRIFNLLYSLRPFNFTPNSKLGSPHSLLIIFTPTIFVVRPFKVVHEAKVTHKNL